MKYHFSLTFGMEVVVPVKSQEKSPRLQFFDEAINLENLLIELDLLENRREQVVVKTAFYK